VTQTSSKWPILVAALVLLGLVASLQPADAVTQYTITDLGTLGGSESHAWSINSLGQVVGHSANASGDLHAFLWLGGTMQDLGTFGGSYSSGMDINASVWVVGAAHIDTGEAHAFRWENGVMHDLGTLGGTYGGGDGINALGEVVGSSWTSSSSTSSLGFVWLPADDYGRSAGVMYALPTLGGTQGWALAISGTGQVVGAAETESGAQHAYLLDLGSGAMQDLGTLGHPGSWAYDINASGQVVGWIGTRDVTANHAFLWQDGTMQDLGLGEAFAINDSGQVVGWHNGHALLWDNGVPVDLNTVIATGSGWVLTSAEDINDSGQIVGWGTINGETHGFLLTPIPEPSALALAGLALLAAIGRARHG
jgi:probable HAF family extracellular repeat protein